MAGEVEVAPDHTTAQRLSELREQSSIARTSSRSAVIMRIGGENQGTDAKQFSIPATNLTFNSNSIAEASPSYCGQASRGDW